MSRIRQFLFAAMAALLSLPAGALLAATEQSSLATVKIAQAPLYGRNQNIHPNLLLTLSVEFPTVGAAYRSGTYSPADHGIHWLLQSAQVLQLQRKRQQWLFCHCRRRQHGRSHMHGPVQRQLHELGHGLGHRYAAIRADRGRPRG
jgi:hypothetical protein